MFKARPRAQSFSRPSDKWGLRPAWSRLPEVPQEKQDGAAPEDWPSEGEVVVEDLSLRYRPDLPRVLDGVSFRIAPAEHVTEESRSALLQLPNRCARRETSVGNIRTCLQPF